MAKTTSFHLNEIMRFDQNIMFWFKTMSFWSTPNKKNKAR